MRQMFGGGTGGAGKCTEKQDGWARFFGQNVYKAHLGQGMSVFCLFFVCLEVWLDGEMLKPWKKNVFFTR